MIETPEYKASLDGAINPDLLFWNIKSKSPPAFCEQAGDFYAIIFGNSLFTPFRRRGGNSQLLF